MSGAPAHFIHKHFVTEVDESAEARKRYNAANEKRARDLAKGWDAVAMDAAEGRRPSSADVPEGLRRVLLQFPTPAGTAMIATVRKETADESFAFQSRKSVMQTARADSLWDVCRDALADGKLHDMAVELGIQRPARGTKLADIMLPLLAQRVAADAAANESQRGAQPPPVPPTQAEHFTAPLRNFFKSPSPSERDNPAPSAGSLTQGSRALQPMEA
jgi:hypothetical protein